MGWEEGARKKNRKKITGNEAEEYEADSQGTEAGREKGKIRRKHTKKKSPKRT